MTKLSQELISKLKPNINDTLHDMKYLISYNPNDNTSNVHIHVHTNTNSMDHNGQEVVDYTTESQQYHNYFLRKQVDSSLSKN